MLTNEGHEADAKIMPANESVPFRLHEGHEEEGCEQDCQGQATQRFGLPWQKRQDLGQAWLDQGQIDQEQAWQAGEQKPGLGQHALDPGLPPGQEGCESEGLLQAQEGHGVLREGHGVLHSGFEWCTGTSTVVVQEALSQRTKPEREARDAFFFFLLFLLEYTTVLVLVRGKTIPQYMGTGE